MLVIHPEADLLCSLSALSVDVLCDVLGLSSIVLSPKF